MDKNNRKIIPFKSKGHLTLGIEIESQLLDPNTLDLKPSAPELLKQLGNNDKIKPEIFQSMVEITTNVCTTVQETETDLCVTIRALQEAAQKMKILIATTGTHPFARYSDRKLFKTKRYLQLIDRNQWIARRLMIFGLHVHLGMRNGDTCIRFNNFFLHFVPHLIALTSSSPFWQGEDTGLASCRSTIFESCPTSGHPCWLKDWKEFSYLCSKLIHSKSIISYKDLWWDIRPSPNHGTMEIRICDSLATLSETLSVIAFIHALAHWYNDQSEYVTESVAPPMWMMRENKWRAMRHGMEADIIANSEEKLIPLREDIFLWIKKISPQINRLGYTPYFAGIERIANHGASHIRQRNVFDKTGSLLEVIRHNVKEFQNNTPLYA